MLNNLYQYFYKFDNKYLSYVFRLVMGVVFLYSGYIKASNFYQSQMAVRAYELLPVNFANFLGILIPWVEIGLGLLLILGIKTKISCNFGISLLLIFIVAIFQAWLRGLSIDCGCFGKGGNIDPEDTRYLEEILRDIVFILMLFYVKLSRYKMYAIDRGI